MNSKLVALGLLLAVFTSSAAAQTVTGSGTLGTVPQFTGASKIGNSPIVISNLNVGIGTSSPATSLHIANNDWLKMIFQVNGTPPALTRFASDGNGFTLVSNANWNGSAWVSDSTSRSSSMIVESHSTNALQFLVAPAGPSVLWNQALNIQSNGKIGFGSPFTDNAAKFQFSGGNLELGGYGSGADYGFVFTPSNTNTFMWLAETGSAGGLQFGAGATIGTGPLMTLSTGGRLGIGIQSPGKPLDVLGAIRTVANAPTGDPGGVIYPDGTQQVTAWTGVLCGGDYAEDMSAAGGKASYSPGDVLVLTSGESGDVKKSMEPYSTLVAGIYATKPGVIGRREAVAKLTDNIPMAMIGVVPTKVTSENGPIHRGDLLVTSSVPGYAMKGTDRDKMFGAVIGKAMGSIDSGTGVIEVLVTLQ